jgi:hypothetical protein
MRQTLTIRLPKGLAAWIEDTSAQTGISQGQLVRQHLERARSHDTTSKKFMRLAGRVRGGPRDLSTRKGFSKK